MRKYLLVFAAAVLCFAACTNSAEKDPGFTRGSTTDADGEPDGQALFVQNCSACHQKDRDAVGPMLKGASARWNGDKTRLYAFIRNSSETIAKGDPRAVELQKTWGNKMPLFTHLTDADIEAILKHVE